MKTMETFPVLPCIIAAQFTPKKASDRNRKHQLCWIRVVRDADVWRFYGTDGHVFGRVQVPAEYTDETFSINVPDTIFKGAKADDTCTIVRIDDDHYTATIEGKGRKNEQDYSYPPAIGDGNYDKLIPETWESSTDEQVVFDPALMVKLCKPAADYADGKVWHTVKSHRGPNRFDCELQSGGLLTMLLMPMAIRERPEWLGPDPAVEARLRAEAEAKAKAEEEARWARVAA